MLRASNVTVFSMRLHTIACRYGVLHHTVTCRYTPLQVTVFTMRDVDKHGIAKVIEMAIQVCPACNGRLIGM